jgi:hypothetical protein
MAPNETITPTLSPGLQEVLDTVTQVQAKVLQPLPVTYANLAKPMADQAAGMMVQDLSTFLHGTEQIMMVAIAKAAAMMLIPPTQETGIKAMKHLQELMLDLPKFAKGIGDEAAAISKEFGK